MECDPVLLFHSESSLGERFLPRKIPANTASLGRDFFCCATVRPS